MIVKVADFGLSRFSEEAEENFTTCKVGPLKWMPPGTLITVILARVADHITHFLGQRVCRNRDIRLRVTPGPWAWYYGKSSPVGYLCLLDSFLVLFRPDKALFFFSGAFCRSIAGASGH